MEREDLKREDWTLLYETDTFDVYCKYEVFTGKLLTLYVPRDTKGDKYEEESK